MVRSGQRFSSFPNGPWISAPLPASAQWEPLSQDSSSRARRPVTLGDLISPAHLLWALIAVYITFLGGTSDREQVRKAAFRVAGTVAGVIVGDGVARLIGLRPVPTLIVIILAVFFMAYFARINYALVVFAVTIGVAQFYAQVGELSTALLTTRVEETAVGAACAIVVGLAVLPLRTSHAARLALAGYLRALAQVLDGLIVPGTLSAGYGARTDARILDASFNAAAATLRPLTRTLLGTVNRRCAYVLRLVDPDSQRAGPRRQDCPQGALKGRVRNPHRGKGPLICGATKL
jgi:uncharacterized membrane protein YccC